MSIRKWASLVLAAAVLSLPFGASAEEAFTAGEYEGSAQGFGGMVNVKLTVDESAITAIEITGDGETPTLGGAAMETMAQAYVGQSDAEAVDSVSGSTITSEAVKTAVASALAAARGEVQETAEIAFTPGTYEGTGAGYNGDVVLSVTFGENSIDDIQVVSSAETEHVGDVAYDIMFEEIEKFTSTGVDTVSGATFTSRAVLEAVNDAAVQAGCDVSALQAGAIPFAYEPQDTIEETYDVVVVGAGGAGMAAGAAAAQAGATVVVVETNAAIGGNTLMAGGGDAGFQAVVDAYVFDPDDPEAMTGVDPIDGEVEKAKSDAGRLETLRMIYNWSEEPFDGTVEDPDAITSIDDYNLPERGVHAEYLDTLKTLKEQIGVYLEYADAHLAAGEQETDLTLFSTPELHIFQTYYGGLRLNADKTEWIYGEYDLVSNVVNNAYSMKEWLISQGAVPDLGATNTLIGCLWQRINSFAGGEVNGEMIAGNWGAYLKVPENTMLAANEANQVMLRTTAKELLTDENGAVVGVKAERYDGTEVILHANKGVVLATGGYAANIEMVCETNTYWSADDMTTDIQTTNRSSLKGDGIVMGQAVGAAVTGMGWTQLMPLGWVDNGDLSLGSGENVIYISPAENENAGKRYVDETAERDVLSQGAFDYGDDRGVYLEFSNGDGHTAQENVEGRIYYGTLDELCEQFGLDKETVEQTITDYDAHVIGTATEPLVPAKSAFRGTIGTCDVDENGNYLPDTYRIETLMVRPQRPSTHHTMGGLVVNEERQVLTEDGTPIEGLYAAGEVTGGFFGGNRLGGNAIVEIVVSGRIAGENAAK